MMGPLSAHDLDFKPNVSPPISLSQNTTFLEITPQWSLLTRPYGATVLGESKYWFVCMFTYTIKACWPPLHSCCLSSSSGWVEVFCSFHVPCNQRLAHILSSSLPGWAFWWHVGENFLWLGIWDGNDVFVEGKYAVLHVCLLPDLSGGRAA